MIPKQYEICPLKQAASHPMRNLSIKLLILAFLINAKSFAEYSDSQFFEYFCDNIPQIKRWANETEPTYYKRRSNFPGMHTFKVLNENKCHKNISLGNIVTDLRNFLFTVDLKERFVSDTVIALLFAKGLNLNDEKAAKLSLRFCMEYIHPQVLKSYSRIFRDNFNKSKFFYLNDSLDFLPLLELEAEDKINLLKKAGTNHLARAMLGDTLSEDTLVMSFKKSTTFQEKEYWAEKLGYLKGRKVVLALLSEISSSVTKKTKMKFVSIRLPILLALERIYPDLTFFDSSWHVLKTYGDAALMMYKNQKLPAVGMRILMARQPYPYDSTSNYVKEFLEKISVWAEQKYDMKIILTDDQYFVCRYFALKRKIFYNK
ncbi:MAG: hypothetical protein ACLFVQ_12600 [Chitinispirillaceae bacterium]